jgi:hypothetical protein
VGEGGTQGGALPGARGSGALHTWTLAVCVLEEVGVPQSLSHLFLLNGPNPRPKR